MYTYLYAWYIVKTPENDVKTAHKQQQDATADNTHRDTPMDDKTQTQHLDLGIVQKNSCRCVFSHCPLDLSVCLPLIHTHYYTSHPPSQPQPHIHIINIFWFPWTAPGGGAAMGRLWIWTTLMACTSRLWCVWVLRRLPFVCFPSTNTVLFNG